MPDRQSSFDTEGEKLAYEFMINWLQFDITRAEYNDRAVKTKGGLDLVMRHQKFGTDSMLDLFKHLQNKYGVPGDEGVDL